MSGRMDREMGRIREWQQEQARKKRAHPSPNMTKDEISREARNQVGRNIQEHDNRHGKYTSHEEAYRQACKIGDSDDKKHRG